jgi:hypothetical protein
VSLHRVASQTLAAPHVAPLSEDSLARWSGSTARKAYPKLAPLFDLADGDVAAAFAQAAQDYSERGIEEVQSILATYLFVKDFTKAPEILPHITSMAMQSAFIRVIPGLYTRDSAGTLAVIRDKLPEKAKADALYRLVSAQVDAGDWSAAMHNQLWMPRSDWRRQAIAAIAGKSGSHNVETELSWMKALADDDERKLAHNVITENLGRTRDDAGLARVLAVTPVDEPPKPGGGMMWNRKNLIRQIAWVRLNKGDGAGLEDLRTMISADEQAEVDSVLIAGDKDLPPAKRIARLWQMEDTHARYNGISSVVGLEWKTNPKQAIDFVMSLPETTFGAAFGSLANVWKDKVELSRWIKALPPGFQRETAIRIFVGSPRYGRGGEKELAREVATWAADPVKREEFELYLSR